MGGINSVPVAPKDVDILPPRFSSLPSHRDSLPFSPISHGFGASERAALFSRHFARPGAWVAGALRPAPTSDVGDVRVKAGVALPLPAAYGGGGGRDFTASLATRGAVSSLGAPLLGQLRLSLSGGGGLQAVGSVGDVMGATGVYATLPLDAMLQRGAGGAEGRVLLGAGRAPAPAAAAALSPAELPEVGLRVSRGAWSAGGHLGAGAPYPFRAWALWGGGSGAVSAGLELSSGGVASLLRAAGNSPSPATGDPLPQPPPPVGGATARGTLALGAALALRQPQFELSLAVDGARGYDVVAGYTQTFVMRRSVYNPLEEARVKGVYQHVDLGVEARKALRPPFAAALDLAAAWQLNRCALLKARVGTERDAALSLALRTWTEPSAVFCVTGSVDGKGEPALGLSLTLASGGDSQYRAVDLGQQRATPSLLIPAKEHINEKRREV